jgi:hypothetical protein
MKHIFDQPQFGENWFNYDEEFQRHNSKGNYELGEKIFKERNP